MTHTHHTIDYIELNVSDLEASKAFYEQAFGWQFNDYGPEYAGIRNRSGDGEVGGLGVGRQPGPGGSLVILYSDDLEGSVAAVEAAGGTVDDIVKWTIYIVDGQSFEEGFAAFMGEWGQRPNPPAITGCKVVALANPQFLVEIEAIAAIPG